MAGYTRQSVADIVNGLDITAPPLTAEFNQIDAAFHGTTGHAHDGSTGNGPRVNLATSVTGFVQSANGGIGGMNKTDATAAPVASNDNLQGYVPGSTWINVTNGRTYRCIGNATNAAVWREEVMVQAGNAILPISTGTIDIGSSSARYKDVFLTTLNLSSTLTVTGAAALNGSTAISALSVSGTATLPTVVISGGTIDGTTIGSTTATTVRGTTITATTGFVGPLTGAVTGAVSGSLSGPVTGNVTGNLTGNVTGNVTAATGTSTFNDVTINGSLNMTSGTAATVTGLSTPVNATDAATKSYVDTSITNLVGAAPAALNTLSELSAAVADDPAFSATVTTSIATKVSKAGDTMTGNLAMSGSKVTGLGAPTATTDAATKTYVDTATGLKLNLAGGTLSGAIAMGNNRITGLATPTDPADAVPKSYADAILGSATAATAAADAAIAAAASINLSSIAITGGSITGITDLAIADGGTGASTAANARTNLGLGTLATQASNAVAITGGTVTGITDLAIADGGTGASTAPDALVNFGLTATAADINKVSGLNTAGNFGLVPTGAILLWSGTVASIPVGWFLCNGLNGTPNLTDRFIVGAGAFYSPGATGGTDEVTLTTAQMPSHSHTFGATTGTESVGHTHTYSGTTGGQSADHSHTGYTDNQGSHEHAINQWVGSTGSGTGMMVANAMAYEAGSSRLDVQFAGLHAHNIQTYGASSNHTHTYSGTSSGISANHTHSFSGTTGSNGTGNSHENRPPYFALAYIMKA